MAGQTSYARGRASGSWRDLPDTSTPITASIVEHWEDALYDLRSVAGALVSPTYGQQVTFGNVQARWFAGTGTPVESFAPLQVYQYLGQGATSPLLKTTQAAAFNINYGINTSEDSAEGFSVFVGMKTPTGVASYVQTKPVTAGEFIANVESGATVSGASVVGVGSRINVISGGAADTVEFLHMALNATGGGGGTITNAYGVRQLTAFGATNNWAVYGIDPIYSESALRVAKSGNGMDFRVDLNNASAFVYAKNPDGATTRPTIRVDAIAAQTASLAEFRDTSGNTAATVSSAGGFISQSGVGFIANKSGVSRMGINRDGLIWIDSALEQTTVGAPGGASALPATPTKYLKVQDNAGTVLVIPAYAA